MHRHAAYSHYACPFALKLAVTILVVIALARYFLPNRRPSTDSAAHIDGRWRMVRSELGLPPVPDRIPTFSSAIKSQGNAAESRLASRFDLKRKRAESTMTQPAELHFAADTLGERALSYDELLDSFHAVVLMEKEVVGEQGRMRAQRQGGLRNRRRPSGRKD